MSGLVFGAPATPAVQAVSGQWVGLRPSWTGWDDSVWELSNIAGGVLLARGGVRGLTMPPFRRQVSSSPGVAGSRWRGRGTGEREVFWPLLVFSNAGSQAWVDRDRAFWRTMHPDMPGVWSVTHPDGSKRSLRCRFVDDGDHAFDILPTVSGWTVYGVRLVAEDPFWRGPVVSRTWKTAAPTQFFGASGGPTFNISSASTIGAASIDNPGDEDAYPVWVIRGPVTSATVGVAGSTITIPFAIADGRMLVIDTNPTAQTAKDMPAFTGDEFPADEVQDWVAGQIQLGNAVNKTRNLGAVSWAPIPKGQSVPLSLSMVGTGSVQAIIEPAYHRAF